jgi:hypothetical protein
MKRPSAPPIRPTVKLALATTVLGLAAGLACGAGCGGGSGGAAGSSGSFAVDYCNLIEPCCAQAGLNTSGTLCQAFANAAASEGSYDAAQGQACITGMQAESSSPTFCTELGNDIPACSMAFTTAGGSVPPGGKCMQDSDCAKAAGGGATCFFSVAFDDGGSTQTQTCVETSVGTAGDGPCVGVVQASGTLYDWTGSGPVPPQGFTCAVADGLTCDDTTQKCIALATVGQACGADSDCVTSAYCSFGSGQAQCATRLADGASCSSAATGCLSTSFCDPTSMTCKPLLANGAACTDSQACLSGDCVNMACSGSNNLGLQLLCGSP